MQNLKGCKEIQHKKYLPVGENSKEGVANGHTKQTEGKVSKVDGCVLMKDSLRKVTMRRKEARKYRGNGTEDEGALWFE